MSELKCPFCGGYGKPTYMGGNWKVICTSCVASSGLEQNAEEAIAAWNRRAAPECPPIRWEYDENKEGWAAFLGELFIGTVREVPAGFAYRVGTPMGEGAMGCAGTIEEAKSRVEEYGKVIWNKIHGVAK